MGGGLWAPKTGRRMSSQAILVGDVGGTNVRLAIAHIDSNSQVELSHVERMPVLSFPSLEDAIDAWHNTRLDLANR